MKRCPTCEKTFDDNMRFCQSDGTPLVEDSLPADPYKTMVASKEDIAAAMPPASDDAPVSKPQVKDEGEVLELPAESDPLKTMYASEEEIRKAMGDDEPAGDKKIDIPPVAPEPPKFSEPSLSPPSFGDMTPPPSPFSQASPEPTSSPSPSATDLTGDPFAHTTPPIPSPFSETEPESSPPSPQSKEPERAPYQPPQFKEQEPRPTEPAFDPFNQPPAQAEWTAPPPPKMNQPLAQAEWTPPPAPDSSWQNQQIGQNTPFQPPMAGTGQNQTLAIVSLILGIVGLLFCAGLTGPPALITGFMARKKVAENPAEYGGAGLALAGIITGAIGTLLLLLFVLYIVFVFFVVGSSLLSL